MNSHVSKIASGLFTVFALLLAGVGSASADQHMDQEKDKADRHKVKGIFSTDRPQATRTPDVVGDEELQLELGLNYTDGQGAADQDAVSLPNTLVRWGISDPVELRVGLPNYADISNGNDADGLSDSTLGFKWAFTDREKGEHGLSLIANTTLPTGSDDIASDDDLDPSLGVQFRSNNPDGWEFGIDLSGNWPTANGNRDFALGSSIITQGRVNKNVDVFFEVAGVFPDDTDDIVNFNTGIKYETDNHGRLDFGLGTGLNDHGPDFSVNVGYSFLFH